MLKVAMVSRWHAHANGYARTIKGMEGIKITAVWDEEAARGREWGKELGVDFEPDYDKLLARPDVDAIICDAPTTSHEDLMIRAAKAKKHIFTEKAMAPTVKECERIGEAIKANGITFVISLPQRSTPVVRLAKKLIDNGDFGKISQVRIRNGHDGVSGDWLQKYWYDLTTTAGGAMMDLGCHPMYMASYLLDEPVKITSLMCSPLGNEMDESATASILYKSGAVCTCETSFITLSTPGALEIYGTDATLLAYGNDVKFISKKTREYTDDYITPKLPPAPPMPMQLFVDACNNGTGSPKDYTIQDGIDLTLLLENSYISFNTGKTVEL